MTHPDNPPSGFTLTNDKGDLYLEAGAWLSLEPEYPMSTAQIFSLAAT